MPKNSKITLGLIGANGRLGGAISAHLKEDFSKKFDLIAKIGRDTADFTDLAKKAEVFIDVSMPAASESYLKTLIEKKIRVPCVIGCTGWTEAQFKTLRSYSKTACVVYAPNFSLCVNLFLNLIETAAPLLKRFGYVADVQETHHTRKLDSPSGTAKAILERLGDMNTQIHSTRAGNIIGTHEVRFFGSKDILSLSHEALDRSIFAEGALIAAQWAVQQKRSGLFSMKDVLFS